VAGYRTTYQDVVFLSEDLYDLQAFHLYAIISHTTRHAHAFHNTAGIGRVTQRTWSTLTIVLTVALLAHTGKSMTLDDTLKAFTLRGTNYLNFIAFSENVYGNRFPDRFLE
jgi:succinate dehydrogenase hydrophobic anchor subunit